MLVLRTRAGQNQGDGEIRHLRLLNVPIFHGWDEEQAEEEKAEDEEEVQIPQKEFARELAFFLLSVAREAKVEGQRLPD